MLLFVLLFLLHFYNFLIYCKLEGLFSKAPFIRQISAVLNSIQLSVAEIRLLIHTSYLCHT